MCLNCVSLSVWLSQEAQNGYVLLVMVCYWCTETVPLAVTGLIPVFMFPLLGIMTVSDVAKEYIKVGLINETTPKLLSSSLSLKPSLSSSLS